MYLLSLNKHQGLVNFDLFDEVEDEDTWFTIFLHKKLDDFNILQS